ncbi:uncharacterized protein LOC131002678 [Salvia miltiorrhiza]|uniref:uncharacterized protein LOC131002678 n=1 Tax=Salvia miltiorrhiza TaxID=226208 RepID=UPI0025AD925C|nr:uncharacterized protein LOC131002678 [Salvia miltiorrhiza]
MLQEFMEVQFLVTRCFRMSRSLFLCILDAVKNYNNFFEQRMDCTGRWSLSTLQKITAFFRILAYGVPTDATDEYISIDPNEANYVSSEDPSSTSQFRRVPNSRQREQMEEEQIQADVAMVARLAQQDDDDDIPSTYQEGYVDAIDLEDEMDEF